MIIDRIATGGSDGRRYRVKKGMAQGWAMLEHFMWEFGWSSEREVEIRASRIERVGIGSAARTGKGRGLSLFAWGVGRSAGG